MMAKNTVILLNLFLVLFIFTSCVMPGYYIENSNLPVPQTRISITTVIGKPRFVSLNGRELTSLYHDQSFEPLDEEKKHKDRYLTKTIILGARRPYEISVQVIREKFDPQTQTYVDLGVDETLSQQRALQIKKYLNKSLDDYQKVDGENPF